MGKDMVALVESNTTGTGALLVAALRARGCDVVLITKDPDRYAFIDHLRLDVVKADTRFVESIAQAIAQAAAGRRICGVTSTSDFYVETAAQVADRFDCPAPSVGSVRCARDKFEQRQCLLKWGLSVPSFALIAGEEVQPPWVDGPCVVKPRFGSGSIGVKLCISAAEVRAHAVQLAAMPPDDRLALNQTSSLVEGYIRGPEFSVEVFDGSVVAVVRKHLGAEPYFVEVGHDTPAGVNPALESELAVAASKAVAALGLTWGPVHVELRVADSTGRPVIIEVNPRLAGGHIPAIVRHSRGIDLIDCLAKRVTGDAVSLNPNREAAAAIRFLVAPGPGTFAGVDGAQSARDTPHVADVSIYPTTGTQVRLRGDYRDRLGHVIAVGNTPEVAAAAAEEALRKITVTIST